MLQYQATFSLLHFCGISFKNRWDIDDHDLKPPTSNCLERGTIGVSQQQDVLLQGRLQHCSRQQAFNTPND